MELLNRLINTFDITKKYSLIKQLKEIIQPGQDEFIEPLLQAIRKEKQNLEGHLRECLVKIGTPAAITAIKETAFDLDDFGSKYTINLLEKFTNHEIEVIKAVTEIFQKTDKKETRQRAFLFLEKKANNTRCESRADVVKTLIHAVHNEQDVKFARKLLVALYGIGKNYSQREIREVLSQISKNHKIKELQTEAENLLQKDNSTNIVIEGRIFEVMNDYLKLEKVTNHSFKEIDFEPFGKNIVTLSLIKCFFTDLSGLEKLPSLKRLFLQKTRIDKKTEPSNFEKLNQLLELGITDCNLESIVLLKPLTNLIKLNLTNARIKEISSINKLIKLRSLNLSKNKITEIKGLENLKNLTELDLSENNIESISGLENLKNLTTLNLSDNNIKSTSGVENLLNLTSLNLANNKISHIIGFEKVPYLLKINLEGNGLPYEKGYNKNGQVLVDYCSGIPFKEAVEKYKVKATVVKVLPFVHPILQYDTKDRCIYCGSKTIFNQENINKCSEHLKKIIIKANERLPGLKTKKKLQIKPSERTVTTFDIRYGTTRVERPLAVKIDKKYLSVDKFYGSIYPSLAGTFCNKCSTDFLESAERIFNNVKTRGKYEAISASVGEAINNYSELLTTWENKIIKK